MLIAVGIGMIVFGVLLLFFYYKIRALGFNLKNWNTTRGTLLNKYIGERQRLPGTEQSNYRVYVEYEYEVGEKKYIGKNYHAFEVKGGEVSGLKRMAENELKKISEHPIVYFNRTNEKISFLKRPSRFTLYLLFIFGMAFLLMGILALLPVG